jgi:SagB-type dehydrogenase family enzyme
MTTAGLRGIRKRDNIPQRWAATAGNLGSVELFLAVRDVEGLEPGFYFYQPHQHSLAMFRRRAGALEPPEFINRAFFNDRAETPDLLVLFTGAFHRVARKYGSFALKLINLDAGVAYSQLQLVARSLNIPCCLGTRWADQLIEDQLNLTPFQEQVTAAVALYQGRLEPSGAELSRCVERWNRPRVSKYLPKSINEFSNLTTGEVCEKLFRESRSTEASLDLPAQAVPATLSHEWRSDVTGVPLPHRCYGGLSVEQTLHKRISVRRYGSSAVSIKQVSTMLTCAHRGDLQDWPDEHRHGLPLTFLVLLSLASEIEPGIYTYNSDKHQLVLYRNRLTSEECSGLFVQNEFAFSPAIIWIAGNLAAACARHGESGYRQLLLRAGAAGHRLWMAGSAMGLVGTLTAGLVARTARKYLGMDDYKRTSLLAFPTGAPYDPADRIHNSCQISVPAMTKVVSKYIPMKHVSKSPMSDCRTGTEPRRRSPIPMAESQILLQREFFEKAMSLRNEFEERFLSKQREGVTPFTYAFCEDRYQLLTADAESLFADDTLQAFLSRLGEWVSGTLSLHQISRPQVRVYIRGCSRSFVKDEINACWHFMLPFTPLSRKRLGSNRAQIVIQTQSGPSNGSGANRDTLVHADLEFNCLLVHAVRNAYKIAPRLDSMNPMSGLAFIDGYFW